MSTIYESKLVDEYIKSLYSSCKDRNKLAELLCDLADATRSPYTSEDDFEYGFKLAADAKGRVVCVVQVEPDTDDFAYFIGQEDEVLAMLKALAEELEKDA